MNTTTTRKQKFFGRFKKPRVSTPNFVEPQLDSFKWLIEKGLKEVFEEFSSIKDFSEKKFTLDFTGFELSEAKYDEYYAKDNKLSYEAPLKVKVSILPEIPATLPEESLIGNIILPRKVS
jgi:DNA-directed RNA polymerase subunit beta